MSSNSGGVSSTSGGPSSTPSPPAAVGEYEYVGCFISRDGFPTFSLEKSSPLMDIELCTSECQSLNDAYAGVYDYDCYCATALDSSVQNVGSGICDIPCPGNQLEACGGNVPANLRRRNVPLGRALDIYEATPTTTTSSSSSSTSSGAPDKSSDPGPAPEPLDIQADIGISLPRRSRDDVKVR
ncbi:hypothetical protein BGZ57DRAFT_1010300 [Hyaloscypha finlandica]|nr:hypothetical protein BGZ57DRAFT_1010300 [Hyaloscypha finlandica]